MTRSLCLLVTVHTVRGARSWKQFGFLEDEDLSRWVAASQLPRKWDGEPDLVGAANFWWRLVEALPQRVGNLDGIVSVLLSTLVPRLT